MGIYCDLADIYDLGLRAESFALRPRPIEAVDPATGILTIRNNGLLADYLFTLSIEGSAVPGKPTALLPGGLSSSVVYQAQPVNGSSDLFRTKPVGGALISSFTNAGTGSFSIYADVGRTLLRIAENESANVDEDLTAHSPPITSDATTGKYPEILRGVVARRTAVRGALVLGLANPTYRESLDSLIAAQADDNRRLASWLKGRPLNVRAVDQTAGIVENGARATFTGEAAGWDSGYL